MAARGGDPGELIARLRAENAALRREQAAAAREHARLLDEAQAFADQIAVALGEAGVAERERRAREPATALAEEERRARIVAARQLDRLNALSGITQQLLAATELETVLQVVVESASRLCEAGGAMVSLIDDGARHARLVAAHGLPAVTFARLRAEKPRALDGAFFVGSATDVALREGKALAIEDYATWPASGARDASLADGVRSLILAPLRVRDVPIGALSVTDPQPRTFAPEDVALVQALADQAALAIEQARLRDEGRASQADAAQRARELAALLEVSAALTSTLELEPLLDLILDQLLRVIDYRSAGIFLVRDGALETVAGRDTRDRVRAPPPLGHRRPLTQVAGIWQPLLRGEPLLIGDLHRDEDPLVHAWRAATSSYRPGALSSAARAWMGVPLSVRGQVVGYLALTREEPDSFTARDTELAVAFAGHAAVALDNARLVSDERSARHQADAAQAVATARAGELAALLEVARSLTATLDLQTLLGAIIDQAKVVADYDGASVLIFDNDALHVAYRRAPDETDRPDRVGARFPLERADLYLRYIRQRQSLIIDDVLGDEPLARAYREMMGVDPAETPYLRYVRSWMGVPIALTDRVIGALVLVHSRPGYYTPHHAELVAAMASQAAVAIENARLYAESRQVAALEERARLARDLHDSVTQSVFGAGMLAHVARTQHERGTAGVGVTLGRIQAVLSEALGELRALLYELQPTALAEEGLARALQKLAGAVQVRTDVPVTCTGELPHRLVPETETAIFRIVQEALANATKYAQATAILISLGEAEGRLAVVVEDDGVGFDPAAPVTPSADGRRGGMGMRSMRERAVAAGLAVRVESAPGQGTRVTVEAPLPV